MENSAAGGRASFRFPLHTIRQGAIFWEAFRIEILMSLICRIYHGSYCSEAEAVGPL